MKRYYPLMLVISLFAFAATALAGFPKGAALSECVLADASEVDRLLIRAPAMSICREREIRDLGLWDDVFYYDGSDFIILAKQTELFSLSMIPSGRIKKLATIPDMISTQMVDGVEYNGHQWLFCQSEETTPFAIDLNSGKKVDFEIPGLRITGEHAPVIQSSVTASHAGGVILMISGGDRDTWPRPGNRPIYFWMGLESGETVQFPAGWDLEYFSADQRVAVFEKPQEKVFQRRPVQAVDMKTGEVISSVPDRREEFWVPFNWSNKDRVKPLLGPRQQQPGNWFAGVSVDGLACPLDILLNAPHMTSVKVLNDWVIFHLRGYGQPRKEPLSLWLSPVKKGAKPKHLADNVVAYELIGDGKCVFGVTGYGAKGTSTEAFLYDAETNRAWNVLDGVERLPALDPELIEKEYIEDKMTLRMIPGFGGRHHDRLVLCLFSHFRGDMRSLILPLRGQQRMSERWRRAVILTAKGQRYMTEVLRQGNIPDKIWLQNSGKIITATYKWVHTESGEQHKIRLNVIDLKLGVSQNKKDNKKARPDAAAVAQRHAAADLTVELMKRNGIWYEDPLNWKILSEADFRREVEPVSSTRGLDLDLANMCAHCMGRLLPSAWRTHPIERKDELEARAIQLMDTTDDPVVRVILLVGLASSKTAAARDTVVAATEDPQLGVRKSACYLVERCTAKSFGPIGVIHIASPASDVDAAGRKIRAVYKSDKTLGAASGADWGVPVRGLRCRVTGPTIIEQGMPLKVAVELQTMSENLEPGVKQLNTFLHDAFLTLSLTNAKTNEVVTIRPYDPTLGMPVLDQGESTVPLDRRTAELWEVSFPLVRERDTLEPGLYECKVEYSFPKEKTRWWHWTKDWESFGFWHGTIVSGPFKLKVLKETPKTKHFFLPARLSLEEDGRAYFRKEGAISVELPVRNGFFVGTAYYRAGELFRLDSGSPMPDSPNRIGRGKSLTIEVFETSDPPCHLWHPSPYSGGYKILWKKTFESDVDENTESKMWGDETEENRDLWLLAKACLPQSKFFGVEAAWLGLFGRPKIQKANENP
jgi:hypothetical protein